MDLYIAFTKGVTLLKVHIKVIKYSMVLEIVPKIIYIPKLHEARYLGKNVIFPKGITLLKVHKISNNCSCDFGDIPL